MASSEYVCKGTAPDATTTFNLNGVGATDAALLALLGAAPGKLLRVGPEHIHHPGEGIGRHGSSTVATGMTGSDTLPPSLVWDRVAWLALHGIDVGELVAEPANWLARLGFLSQFFADLKNAGARRAAVRRADGMDEAGADAGPGGRRRGQGCASGQGEEGGRDHLHGNLASVRQCGHGLGMAHMTSRCPCRPKDQLW